MATIAQALANSRGSYVPPVPPVVDPMAEALASGGPVTDPSRLAAASQRNQIAANAMANYAPRNEPQTLTQGPPTATEDIWRTLPSTIAKLPYYLAGAIPDALEYGMQTGRVIDSYLGNPTKTEEEISAANPMRDLTSSALQGDYERATGTDYYEPQTGPGVAADIGLTLALPGPGGKVKVATKAGKAAQEAVSAMASLNAPKGAKAAIKAVTDAVTPVRKTITVKGEQRYVGAPPGINTPEAEEALIQSLIEKAKAGREGAGFYTDFQEEIRRNTQDPVMARRFAGASGTTSQDVSPPANTTFALTAMNQQAVGTKPYAGRYPNSTTNKLQQQLPTGDLPAEDPKTGQYGINLLPKEFRPPEGPFIARSGFETYDRPVHDQHDFAAFGYADTAQGGANIARHKYMDRIYKTVNERLNAEEATDFWNNETTQASIWRTQRGPGNDPSIREMVDERKGISQMAAIPGPTTRASPKLLDASAADKEAYTKDMFDALSDESGGNVIARSLAFSTPPYPGWGPWKGRTEPNRVIDLSMGSKGVLDPTDPKGKRKIKQSELSSEETARAARQWNQFGLGQEAAGFTTPTFADATRENGDLAVFSGFQMKTEADYQRAFDLAEQTFGPDWGKRVVVMPTTDGGSGLMLKNVSSFDDSVVTMSNPEFHTQAKSFGKGQPARDLSSQFDTVKWNNPEYRTLLEGAEQNPALKERFDTVVIPALKKVQGVSEVWAKRMGVAADTVPDRVRRIITDAGPNWPQAIKDAVKKGTIPVVAGMIALRALRDADQDAAASGGGA